MKLRTMYTATEIAKLEGVDVDDVRRRCAADKIPGARQPNGPRGRWLIPASYVYDSLGVTPAERAAILEAGAA